MLERRFLLETSALADEKSEGDILASAAAHRTSPVEAYRHLSSDITQITGVRPAPVAWMATLFGILAAAVGLWFLAHDSDTWQLGALWSMISDHSMNEGRLTESMVKRPGSDV